MNLRVFGASALIMTTVGSLTAMRAKAASVCGTLDECRVLKAQIEKNLLTIEARIQEVVGRESTLGDIARNTDGSVRHMNQYDADKYCQAQGARLPTIREMAAYSQSLEAKGILETAYPGIYYAYLKVDAEIKKMNEDGYYPIYTSNSADETTVDFYFNYSGYHRPSGDLGNYSIWSSSVIPHASGSVYGLVGASGDLYFYDRSQNYNDNAVRCMR